jgi:TP901 family phage tail tape measure protein
VVLFPFWGEVTAVGDYGFGFICRFRDDVSAGVARARAAIDGLWGALRNVQLRAGIASAAVGGFSVAASGVRMATGALSTALATSGYGLDRWANRVVHARTQTSLWGRVIRSIAFFTGLRMGYGVLRDFIQAGVEYEQTVTNIGTVLNASGAEMRGMSERMRHLGRTTAFSAQENADAMLVLAKAGLEGRDALNTLTPALNLAVVGELKMEKATEILIASMAQFQKGPGEAVGLANTLAAAANATTAEVSGLARGLAHAGPPAHLAGMSFSRTTAILGMLDQAGYKAARGGIVLRNMLTDLTSFAPKTEKAFAKLGIKMKDIDPRRVDFKVILDRLTPLLGRQDLAAKAFEKRMYGPILALIQQGSSYLTEVEQKMGKALTAADIYALRIKTLGGAYKMAKNQAKEFGLELYDQMRPFLLDRVKSLAGGFRSLGNIFYRLRPTIRMISEAVRHAFESMGKAVNGSLGGMFPTIAKLATAGRMTKEELEKINMRFTLFAAIMITRVKRFFSGFSDGFSDAVSITWKAVKILWGWIHNLGVKVGIFADDTGKASDKMRGWGYAIGLMIGSWMSFKTVWTVTGWVMGPAQKIAATAWWLWSNLSKAVGLICGRLLSAVSITRIAAIEIVAYFNSIRIGLAMMGAGEAILGYFTSLSIGLGMLSVGAAASGAAILLGIAAAGYAIYNFATNEQYRSDVLLGYNTLFGSIKRLAGEFKDWISGFLPDFSTWGKRAADDLRDIFQRLGVDIESWHPIDNLVKSWTAGISVIRKLFKSFTDALSGIRLPDWLNTVIKFVGIGLGSRSAYEAANRPAPNILRPAALSTAVPGASPYSEAPNMSFAPRPYTLSYGSPPAAGSSGSTVNFNEGSIQVSTLATDAAGAARTLTPLITDAMKQGMARGLE